MSISDSFHVKTLNELQFVHETSQWVGPTFRDGLKVLNLMEIQINEGQIFSFSSLFSSWCLDEGFENNWA